MNDAERYSQYKICQARGHEPSGRGIGDWHVCKHCETVYRYVTNIEEWNVPDMPQDSSG